MYKLILSIVLIIVAIFVIQKSTENISINSDISSVRLSKKLSLSKQFYKKPLRDPEKLRNINEQWKKIKVKHNKTSRIKWRDEETSKELVSVQIIPNRYGDITPSKPFHTQDRMLSINNTPGISNNDSMFDVLY